MLVHRLRRWPNNKSALTPRIVFHGIYRLLDLLENLVQLFLWVLLSPLHLHGDGEKQVVFVAGVPVVAHIASAHYVQAFPEAHQVKGATRRPRPETHR